MNTKNAAAPVDQLEDSQKDRPKDPLADPPEDSLKNLL